MLYAYRSTIELTQQIKDVDSTNEKLLLLRLPRIDEHKHCWEATIKRLFFLAKLLKLDITTETVFQILKPQGKKYLKTDERKLLNYHKVFSWLRYEWYMNPAPINSQTIEELFQRNNITDYRIDHRNIDNFLRFIQIKTEHPLNQAALCYYLIPEYIKFPEHSKVILSHLTTYLVLYKNGYDFRDLLILEEATYQKLFKIKPKVDLNRTNLAKLIEHFTFYLNTYLEKLIIKIEQGRFDLNYPPAFFSLTRRQQQILELFNNPEVLVNNRLVQQQFKVSQITASRDLSKLASLGLILTAGSGRSVYYLKI